MGFAESPFCGLAGMAPGVMDCKSPEAGETDDEGKEGAGFDMGSGAAVNSEVIMRPGVEHYELLLRLAKKECRTATYLCGASRR